MERYTTRPKYRDTTCIFLSPFPQGMSKTMEMMVLRQEKIYQRYCVHKSALPDRPLYQDPDLQDIDSIFETTFAASQIVPLEMFFYSIKCVEGLLPDDYPEAPVPTEQQLELESIYLELLKKHFERAIRYADSNIDFEGKDIVSDTLTRYIHILQDWPDGGTWRTAKRLAIKAFPLFPRHRPETKDAEQVIATKYLYDLDLWRVSYETLTNFLNEEYDAAQMCDVLNFMIDAGNSREQEKKRRFSTCFVSFTNLMRSIANNDPNLFDNLLEEASRASKIPTSLNGCLRINPEDPLQRVANEPYETQKAYIRMNMNPYEIQWRRWLENLQDEDLFQEVKTWFAACYGRSDFKQESFFLNCLPKMKNTALGQNFLLEITNSKTMLPKIPEEKFVFKSAMFLGDIDDIKPRELFELYESLESTSRGRLYGTIGQLMIKSAFSEELFLHIRNDLVANVGKDDNATITSLLLLKDYYMVREIRNNDGFFPIAELLVKIKQACHYDSATKLFNVPPSIGVLNLTLELIDCMIDRRTRNGYRDFLFACLDTPASNRAKTIIQGSWNEGVES